MPGVRPDRGGLTVQAVPVRPSSHPRLPIDGRLDVATRVMEPSALSSEVGEEPLHAPPVHRRRTEGGTAPFAPLPTMTRVGQAKVPALPVGQEAAPHVASPHLATPRAHQGFAMHGPTRCVKDTVPTHPLRAGVQSALPEAGVVPAPAWRKATAAQVGAPNVLLAALAGRPVSRLLGVPSAALGPARWRSLRRLRTHVDARGRPRAATPSEVEARVKVDEGFLGAPRQVAVGLRGVAPAGQLGHLVGIAEQAHEDGRPTPAPSAIHDPGPR